MNWKFWENNLEDDIENELETGIPVSKIKVNDDEFTTKDFIKVCCVALVVLFVYNSLSFGWDKAKCAYTGYTYEKQTKRPIFSECLIQMKDGSYVPLDRYINRVLTFNDLGNGEQ